MPSFLWGLAALFVSLSLGPRTANAALLAKTQQRSVTGRFGRPGVTANPDVHVEDADDIDEADEEYYDEEYGGKQWNIEGPEGGSDKSVRWRKKKGGGIGTWLGAVAFICLIGSLPLTTHLGDEKITKTHIFESVMLYAWLLGGLYLFTQVLIFQSPHFEHPRSLSTEEAVYLYAQILTTVGYGDITPARPRGQLCVGLFVLTAILLISSMIQDMLDFFQARMEGTMDSDDDAPQHSPRTEKHALRQAFEPVIYASLVFCCFVAFGAGFFVLYPGEGKTPAQGVYMSLITLSTVGFGAFTPTTHAGMVVGAYWMIFGCSSLMAVVTSRAAFSIALKNHELRHIHAENQREERLKMRAIRGLAGKAQGTNRWGELRDQIEQQRRTHSKERDTFFGSRRSSGANSWGSTPNPSKEPSGHHG